jgi:hypothetical protein
LGNISGKLIVCCQSGGQRLQQFILYRTLVSLSARFDALIEGIEESK